VSGGTGCGGASIATGIVALVTIPEQHKHARDHYPSAADGLQQGIKHATSLIYNAKQEGGASTPLFKVLQTNACRYACRYCYTSFAICHKRTTFKPDELSTTFVSLRTIGRLLSGASGKLTSVL
jgi:hypothetical protein